MTDAKPTDAKPTDDELTTQVRAWLEENWHGLPPAPDRWNPGPEHVEWAQRVHDAGYAVPTWPTRWKGLGLSAEQAAIIEREFTRVGAPGARKDTTSIPANTILAHGNPQLQEELIEDFVTGRARMCLLYSEPSAGSDLAAVRTTAVREGDEYVVTGQKVWTSGAMTAHYGILLARTDWDAPKHRGLSLFILPMKQDGIEVRPLRQITGESHFNEVFIDGARMPAHHLVGELGEGWSVLQTALAVERSFMGGFARRSRHGTADDVVAATRDAGRIDDPVARRDLAGVLALRELNTLTNARAKAEGGTTRPALLALSKLAMANVLHAEAAYLTDLLGAESMLAGEGHDVADDVNFLALDAYFTSIGGGTNQIQRNIIAERVLRLPREAETDKSVPFREVPSN